MTTIYIKQFAIDALFNADKPPIGGAVSAYLYRDELPGSVAFAPVAVAVAPVVQAEPFNSICALIGEYYGIAWNEGREGRNHDTIDGEAADCLHRLQSALRAALAAPAPALAARQLRDLDNSLTETIKDRDCYHKWADKLAGAIAEHFGEDIGEHSNMNNPWAAALDVIAEAKPSPALAAPPALLAQIMNIPVAAHVEAMDDARRLQYKQGHRDARHAAADLVSAATASVAGLVGAQPGAVQVVPREWRNALRKLAFMARTSGGTAGPDAALMSALNEAEALLSMPYLHTAATPAPQPEAPAAVQPESATCGCTPWEQQHCAGARSPYAEHPHCERMKAPSAVQPVPAPADVLLSVIQTLNAVPYNLTKRECIAQVEAMRAAHLATGDAS